MVRPQIPGNPFCHIEDPQLGVLFSGPVSSVHKNNGAWTLHADTADWLKPPVEVPSWRQARVITIAAHIAEGISATNWQLLEIELARFSVSVGTTIAQALHQLISALHSCGSEPLTFLFDAAGTLYAWGLNDSG